MPDRTGVVLDFRIELLAIPGNDEKGVYYRVTIADNKAGANAEEYKLIRNISSSTVDRNSSNDKPWALSYGSLELAIIATLKDALIHQLPVTVSYWDVSPDSEFGGVDNRISAVRLHQS